MEGVGDAEGDWFYYARPEGGQVQEHEEYFANFKLVEPGLLQLVNVQNGLPCQ